MPQTAVKFLFKCLFMGALCLAHGGVRADLQDEIEEILQLQSAPPGVVFEIVSGNKDFLEEAVPRVLAASERLRSRFENISIAVVTHGREQFALMRENADRNQEVHDLVARLTAREEIPVHVCGTHAEWFGIPPEAFPEYVDVAPAGPVQVQLYRELGYRVVLVR